MSINHGQYEKLLAPLFELSQGLFPDPLVRDEFHHELRGAADMVNSIIRRTKELYDFTVMLNKGELNTQPPSADNNLSAPLRELHARLRHLTWQAAQIERGDYKQTSQFMPEFSAAFNKVAGRLAEREQQLKSQVEFNRRSRQALVRSFRAVTGILENLTDRVILVRNEEILFFNSAAGDMVSAYQSGDAYPKGLTFLNYILMDTPAEENATYNLFDELDQRWYSIHYIRMDWVDGEPADLFVATDITEHKRKEQTLKVAADTDALTGVGNRSYGVGALHESLLDSLRYPICVCFIDIDGLKYVNDTFGHAEGDFFIKSVADAIKSSIRRNDVIARMGGDEFLLLYYNVEQQTAQAAIERMQEKLSQVKIESGFDYKMSFSYGITVISKNTGKSAEEYIDMADHAMYMDKKRKKGGADGRSNIKGEL